MRRPWTVALPLLLLASGCSGGADVDPGAVEAGLADRSATAYEEAGISRTEDFERGARSRDSCFLLDDEALAEIASSLGAEDLTASPTFVFGPPESESASCSLTAGEEVVGGLYAGTTDDDRQGVIDVRVENDSPPQIDGEAEGLDADDYVGFGDGEMTNVLWIHEGVVIGLNVSTEGADTETAFAALPVVVEQVGRVLASD